MASKSKKRRRVLGASCILAALIVAGSSFAWFTSKDEVTNRLTANSDYGVSIVESFIPPQNMIPGESVNKDVYAVNTGSMDAFVKETISGVLNYTYETRVSALDKDCIKLDDAARTEIDGATTNQSYFLALAPTGVETGYIRSERVADDSATPDEARWEPSVTGLYVFRRAITEAKPADADWVEDFTPDAALSDEEKAAAIAANDAKAAKPETYTYSAYYYQAEDDGDITKGYYKVVLRDDAYRAASETPDIDNGGKRFVFDISVDSGDLEQSNGDPVIILKDGLIDPTTPPQHYFVKDKEVTNADVNLYYHAKDETGNPYGAPYLGVRYTDGVPDAASETAATNLANAIAAEETARLAVEAKEKALADAQAAFASKSAAVSDAQIAMENAIREYNSAKSRYDQTNDDYNYARDLATATNKLYAAALARAGVEAQDITNKEALDAAIQAVKDAIYKAADDTTDPATPASGVKVNFADVLNLGDTNATAGTDDHGISPDDLVPSNIQTILENGKASLPDPYNSWKGLYPKWDNIKSLVTDVNTLLDNINAISTESVPSPSTTEGTIEYYEAQLATKLAALESALGDYNTSYNQWVEKYNEQYMTHLDAGTNSTVVTDFKARVTAMKDDVAVDNADGKLAKEIDDYVTAYNTYHNYHDGSGTYPTAINTWNTAVNTYNNEVSTAKNTYTGTGELGINKVQDTPNAFATDGKLTDNGTTIVPQYSAHTTAGQDDPTIASPANFYEYLATYNSETGVGTKKDDILAPIAIKEDTENPGSYVNDYFVPANDTTGKLGTDFAQIVANYADYEVEADSSLTAPQTVKALKEKLDAALAKKNEKTADYNSANTGDIPTLRTAITTAENQLATAKSEYGDAKADTAAKQKAFNSVSSTSDIQFDVVLAADAEDNWQYDNPSTTDPLSYKEADFYYKHVLENGETSEKLVDYVKFLSTVTANDYKDLTFDLNVDLDSAQVTYADNQKDYTATAVEGNETDFTLTVDTITEDAVNDEYDVTWKART